MNSFTASRVCSDADSAAEPAGVTVAPTTQTPAEWAWATACWYPAMSAGADAPPPMSLMLSNRTSVVIPGLVRTSWTR
jgi:hypothetical protein